MIDMQFHHTYHSEHASPITIFEHTHPCHELVYFVYGDGLTHIRGKEYSYHGNCFAFYRAGTVHDEVNPVPCETLSTTFLCEFPDIPLEEGVFRDGDQKLFSLIRKLRRLSLTSSPHRDVLTEACLANILVTAEKIQKHQSNSGEAERPKINWSTVIDMIDNSYREEVNFHEIASEFHYSYNRFRHLFAERFSVSPHEYLLMRRLEHAETLLLRTKLNVTEIAYRTGFNTSSAFSKAFRKRNGMSPKEYRQLAR
ncbi:MAG: helix-turn-helix transcriptional regulator [Clostridia bacterium]|nr:helix-turn-helix transcriptional regulator [Clostridia bacterium]